MMSTELMIALMLVVSVLISASSLDDAFVDLLACGIFRSRFLSDEQVKVPTTGIFVANWQEEEVLAAMVEGNLARITNQSVKLFLGVYPNDVGTRAIAEQLAAKHPDRVRVVINSLSGPTSKGQMLNEMFRQVFALADAPELCFTTVRTSLILDHSMFMPLTRGRLTLFRFPCFHWSQLDALSLPQLTWMSSRSAIPESWWCVMPLARPYLRLGSELVFPSD
jgi:hypothetical protein